MIIIDPKGIVVYNGAIDDKPTANVEDVAGAKNYVAAALAEAMAGKPVSIATSRPYGCAVSYPGLWQIAIAPFSAGLPATQQACLRARWTCGVAPQSRSESAMSIAV